MADGTIQFMRQDIDSTVLMALLSREGGEKIDAKAWQ